MNYPWIPMPQAPNELVSQSVYRPPLQDQCPSPGIFHSAVFYPFVPPMQTPGLLCRPTAAMMPPHHVTPGLFQHRCPRPFQPTFKHGLPYSRVYHYHNSSFSRVYRKPGVLQFESAEKSASETPKPTDIPLNEFIHPPIQVETLSETARIDAIRAEYDLLPFWVRPEYSTSSLQATGASSSIVVQPEATPQIAKFRYFPEISIRTGAGPIAPTSPAETAQQLPLASASDEQKSSSNSTNITAGEVKMTTASSTKPFCALCKNNGESETFYKSHVLKMENGETACPVLQKLKCPLCGKQGAEGHTLKYCPLYVPIPGQPQKFGRNAVGRYDKIKY